MALNDKSQGNFTTALLIADTFKSTNGSVDSLDTKITKSTALEIRSSKGALLISRLSQGEINALTPTPGMIVYNTTTGQFNVRSINGWFTIINSTTTGDVLGPVASVAGNIAVFYDTSGKVIADSGIHISQVAPPILPSSKKSSKKGVSSPDSTIIDLSGIGALTFENSNNFGYFYVNPSLVYTISYNASSDTNSVVFTDGVQIVPTNPSCLVELSSTTGALLLSRMSKSDRDNLTGTAGMIIYNSDTDTLDAYHNSGWAIVSGNVNGPASSNYRSIPVFNDVSGRLISDTSVYIDSSNNLINPYSIVSSAIVAGTYTGSPTNSSVALEVQTTTGALLLSRLTATERDNLTAENGMLIYNLTDGKINAYEEGEWLDVSGSGSITRVNTGTGLTGGPITTIGTISIANTGVSAGSYVAANITVNAQGQITSAANGPDGTVKSIGISSTTSGLSVSNSPVTTSGTISLTLNANLQNLSTLSGPGLVARIAGDTGYVLRSLTAGSANISILNADGSAANPSIDLNHTLTGLTSISVGNITLAANTISSTNTNGNIVLSPNGTGAVSIGNLNISGNTIGATNSSGNINLVPHDIGYVSIGDLRISSNNILNPVGNLVLSHRIDSGYYVVIDNLNIAGNTISSNNGNGDVIVSPDGSGSFIATCDAKVDGALKLYGLGGLTYVGFEAPMTPTNVTWTLPAMDGTTGQAMATDGFGSLSWVDIGTPDATYILQTPNSDLPHAQALSTLSILGGILKSLPGGSVAIAVPDLDYATVATLEAIAAEAAGSAASADLSALAAAASALAASIDAAAVSGVTSAKFIVQTTHAQLSNAQSLGALTNGLLLNTVTGSTGVLSVATPGTDYYSPGNPTTIIDTQGTTLSLFVGTQAGNNSFSGDNHVGIGYQALLNISSGSNSTAVGYQALKASTGNGSNSALGALALSGCTGSNNASFGYASGNAHTSYSGCTFLGCNADASNNGLSNATAIGYNAFVSASNCLVLGSGAYVGIGNAGPAYTLSLGNISSQCAIHFAGSTTTPTTPVSGTGIVYVSSNNLFYANNTNTYNITALPSSKYILQTVDSNLPNAQSLGALTTGLLKNTVTSVTGVLSTATAGTDYYSPGNPTTIIDTSGSTLNLFVGTSAGNGSITGNHDTGFGYQSSMGLTSGSDCTSVGYQSLKALTSGGSSTAVGSGSLKLVTTTSNNSALGYNSGAAHSDYVNCTFLGTNTDSSVAALTNTTVIGYNASAALNNSVILGNGCNVGIGTSSPHASLTVIGGQIINVTELTSAASPYTVLTTDYMIGITSISGGVFSVVLPTASATNKGQVYIVKDESGTVTFSNLITITVNGGGNIDNVTSVSINRAYGALQFYSNGTQWYIW